MTVIDDTFTRIMLRAPHPSPVRWQSGFGIGVLVGTVMTILIIAAVLGPVVLDIGNSRPQHASIVLS